MDLQCVKCGGRMVNEDWQGGERDTECPVEEAFRCINCGLIMDETIAVNRTLNADEVDHARREEPSAEHEPVVIPIWDGYRP